MRPFRRIECLLWSWMGLYAVGAFAVPMPDALLDPTWNDAVEFLLTSGAIQGVFRTSRPYRVGEVLEGIREPASRTPLERGLVRRMRAGWESADAPGFGAKGSAEFLLRPEQSPRLLPGFRAALFYNGVNGFSLDQEWDVVPEAGHATPVAGGTTATQRRRGWNPFEVFPQKGYVADFRRAVMRVRLAEDVWVGFGRQSLAWGPGSTGNLLLSDASPGFDGVTLQGTFSRVKGTAVFASLNPIWHDDGTRRYLARRYFSAHRVDWKLLDALEIGISDAILYGGDGRSMEWYYLNPVLPFYASQFNASTPGYPDFLDDNALVGFDFLWMPRKGWAFYGEGIVDDFAYDPASNDPNALGWIVGLHRAGWKERGEWRLEYARAGRWVYTHLVPEQQYTHFGASLGYPLGNDADTFLANVAWWVSPETRLECRLSQARKGASDVNDRFQGETDTAFLKGLAETRRSVALGGWTWLRGSWRAQGEVKAVRVRNPGHVAEPSRTQLEWRGALAHVFGE